jgi:hypothetical protein
MKLGDKNIDNNIEEHFAKFWARYTRAHCEHILERTKKYKKIFLEYTVEDYELNIRPILI